MSDGRGLPVLAAAALVLGAVLGHAPCPGGEILPGAVLMDGGREAETSTLDHATPQETSTRDSITISVGCTLGQRPPCLRKSCSLDIALEFSNMACVQRENEDRGSWFKSVLSKRHGENMIPVDVNVFCLGLLIDDKPCVRSKATEMRLLNESQSYIRASDASLCILEGKKEECVTFDYFCHDLVVDVGSYGSILCSPMNKKKKKGKRKKWGVKFLHTKEENFAVNIFKYMTQTVSSVALLFMLMLYATASELRSLHGKCHMCHATSLLVYYSMQNLLMYGGEALRTAKGICFILGPGEIYFYLAPLTWLNAMSVDIMLAFLCLRPIMPGGRDEGVRKFVLYSSYAWGVPLLVLLITVIEDVTEEMDQQPTMDDWCEIGAFRNWKYRKYPMFTLLSINGIIFGVTALKIYSLKRNTSKSLGHESRRHCKDEDGSNARTKMYFRLLLLMGFHWVLEPVAKALHTPLRLNKRWFLRVMWYVIALVNRLQGVFILIMFVRNTKLTNSVWDKLFKSRLWSYITSKIIMVSSLSSTKTSTGIALEEGLPSSKGGNTSKRVATTFEDKSKLPPGPTRESRSRSIEVEPSEPKSEEDRSRRWSTDTSSTVMEEDSFSSSPDVNL